jgi:hypothetical protein
MTIEQLRDWQENGDDENTLEFYSFEQIVEHLWDDYSILKAKKKDREKANKSKILTSVALHDVPAATRIYKFANLTAHIKRKSLKLLT